MGATMWWQQSISPNTITDPTQAKIMKFLPLIFTFFFITFPAGLTLYWLTNNLFSVAQQYYVNSIFAKEKAKKAST
jgi:YidC/Oxa1 family membrane protein insertase